MNEKHNLYNNSELISFRRQLRKMSTPAEIALWRLVSKRQLGGVKFRRQFSIGNYVLDFYSPELKLCIELDGQPHFTPEGKMHDDMRTEYLRRFHNIYVIRFENQAIFDYTETVLTDIMDAINLQRNATML